MEKKALVIREVELSGVSDGWMEGVRSSQMSFLSAQRDSVTTNQIMVSMEAELVSLFSPVCLWHLGQSWHTVGIP